MANVNLQLEQENSRLFCEVQYWKQLYMGTAPDMQRAIREAENLSDQLSRANFEISVLRGENEKIQEEISILNEDRSAQVELADSTKTYASLLENMLDNVSEQSSPVTYGSDITKRDDHDFEEMEKTVNILQQENKDLNDMMEEFKNMWTKDSNDFQEALKIAKEEKSIVQMEILKLKQLHDEDQVSLAEQLKMKEEEENAHEETLKANSELQFEVKKLTSDLNEAKRELRDLLDGKRVSELRMAQQEYFMKSQHEELTVSLAELIQSRNETAEQLEEMKANWKLKEDAYENEISQVGQQREDEKKSNEKEQLKLTDRLRELYDEIEEQRHEHSRSRKALEKQLHMIKSESNQNYARYAKLEAETLKLQQALTSCNEAKDKDSEMFALTINKVETQLDETKSKLKEITRSYEDARATIQRAEVRMMSDQEEIFSLAECKAVLENQKQQVNSENEQLRERLISASREYIKEKEKMEQKQEDTIVVLHQKYYKQIEEMKHNNMLAINQEMIKSQMALDVEKKKNTTELDIIKKQLAENITESEAFKSNSEASIASLNQALAAVRDDNAKMYLECTQLKTVQMNDRAKIKSMENTMEKMRAEAVEQQKAHEQEVNEMKEAHKTIMDNMGVEELDDEHIPHNPEEKNGPIEWELVNNE